MAKSFDYLCPNGHAFEKFFWYDEVVATLPCQVCGADADKTWLFFPQSQPSDGLKKAVGVLRGKGRVVDEPGLDAEILQNKKDNEAKWTAKLGDKFDRYAASGELLADARSIQAKINYVKANGPDALPDKEKP